MRRALGGKRSQQVMDEGQPENDRREKADDRNVRCERQEQPKKVERATAPTEKARHLLCIGVLGQRVIAQQALVHPAEDDERDERPKGWQEPQRDAEYGEPEHAGKGYQPVPAGAGNPAAAPALELWVRAAGN